MRKEIEIQGCIEIPADLNVDQFVDEFINWIQSKGCFFGGGFREIVDGNYILPDCSKGKHVSDE